ncbi:unnamed protein product [Cochlearia groenlandica]
MPRERRTPIFEEITSALFNIERGLCNLHLSQSRSHSSWVKEASTSTMRVYNGAKQTLKTIQNLERRLFTTTIQKRLKEVHIRSTSSARRPSADQPSARRLVCLRYKPEKDISSTAYDIHNGIFTTNGIRNNRLCHHQIRKRKMNPIPSKTTIRKLSPIQPRIIPSPLSEFVKLPQLNDKSEYKNHHNNDVKGTTEKIRKRVNVVDLKRNQEPSPPTVASRSYHLCIFFFVSVTNNGRSIQSHANPIRSNGGLDDILRRGNNNEDFGSESSNEVNPPSLNQNDQAIVPQKESNQPQEPVVENRTDAPAQPSTRSEGKTPIVEIPSSSLSSSSWSPSVKNHIEEPSIRPK